jgi:beta-galactosidase/beta-glucuronidase
MEMRRNNSMIRRLPTCLLLLISCHAVWAADWQPAAGPLMTPWAKDVSPDNVWPEYPRPQLVRDDWTNLNGLWDYAIQPNDASKPAAWQGSILVPFPVESALSGVMQAVSPKQQLWYRRTFSQTVSKPGERVLLHFGAVDWECQVWVNGQRVGSHRGGYDPFSFDISSAVQEGDNELVVAVWDPTDVGYQPRGKQVLKPHGIMYTAVTGIWQTVWLETVPAAHIEGLKIVPDVDAGVVRVAVDANQQGGVVISVSDGDQQIVQKTGQVGETVELPIKNAKLWSPSHSPHLYDVKP